MVDEQTENMLEILGASSDDELYRAAAYTAITLGALIFVTSLFGCVGAFSECTWMLAIVCTDNLSLTIYLLSS